MRSNPETGVLARLWKTVLCRIFCMYGRWPHWNRVCCQGPKCMNRPQQPQLVPPSAPSSRGPLYLSSALGLQPSHSHACAWPGTPLIWTVTCGLNSQLDLRPALSLCTCPVHHGTVPDSGYPCSAWPWPAGCLSGSTLYLPHHRELARSSELAVEHPWTCPACLARVTVGWMGPGLVKPLSCWLRSCSWLHVPW